MGIFKNKVCMGYAEVISLEPGATNGRIHQYFRQKIMDNTRRVQRRDDQDIKLCLYNMAGPLSQLYINRSGVLGSVELWVPDEEKNSQLPYPERVAISIKSVVKIPEELIDYTIFCLNTGDVNDKFIRERLKKKSIIEEVDRTRLSGLKFISDKYHLISVHTTLRRREDYGNGNIENICNDHKNHILKALGKYDDLLGDFYFNGEPQTHMENLVAFDLLVHNGIKVEEENLTEMTHPSAKIPISW